MKTIAGSLTDDHFFTRKFLPLKILATLYVVALVLSHSVSAADHVWFLAAFFSVVMNATYPWAAITTGQAKTLEFTIATALVVASLLGLVLSPIWLIAAVFGHGVWDLFKHSSAGVSFFRWYTLGCVTVDWIYAGALLWFFVEGNWV